MEDSADHGGRSRRRRPGAGDFTLQSRAAAAKSQARHLLLLACLFAGATRRFGGHSRPPITTQRAAARQLICSHHRRRSAGRLVLVFVGAPRMGCKVASLHSMGLSFLTISCSLNKSPLPPPPTMNSSIEFVRQPPPPPHRPVGLEMQRSDSHFQARRDPGQEHTSTNTPLDRLD